VALPGRGRTEEDTFVARWSEVSDPEALLELIEEAMGARRPQLAARLVGLLPDEADAGDHEVVAARRAARLLLLDPHETPERAWSALEDAWEALRKRRMRRIKERMRNHLEGRTIRTGRLDHGRGRNR
jgi:hypothetical protein